MQKSLPSFLLTISVTMVSLACGLFTDRSGHLAGVASSDIEATITWLRSRPIENILKFQEVKDYLAEHKVYVSLTSSPARLAKLPYVLQTLDLSLIDKIIVALPEKFGRNNETYEIPDEVKNFAKVEIVRIPRDLGPATKLVPAVEYALERGDPNAIVITVDDDTGYPIGMVGQIIKEMIRNPDTVVGASTQPLNFWSIDARGWPDQASSAVIEGFGGVGYKPSYVNTAFIKKVAEDHLPCYLSDDLLISWALAAEGIQRSKLSNVFYNLSHIRQYSYGFAADALHRGAGDPASDPEASAHVNGAKYRACYRYLAWQAQHLRFR